VDSAGQVRLRTLLATPENTALVLQRLSALCGTFHGAPPAGFIPTQIHNIDETLPGGGLARGTVHEWIGIASPDDDQHPAPRANRLAHWSPPRSILIQVARSALAAPENGRRHTVWIGPAIWPYAHTLAHASDAGHPAMLERAVFVRAIEPADRLWAIDLALRNPSVAAVIADGSGFDLSATRRLQLAAEDKGGDGGMVGGVVCLLARPPWERSVLSAACTRWLVSCCPSSVHTRRWTVELLRCKGKQPASHAPRVWTLERDHATRHLRLAADLLDRPGEEGTGAMPIRRAG